jgi:DNA polymerase-3 subunit beta
MKCVIAREALLSGLQIVQNVVSTRTTLPILGNALVQAADGKLVISTTDLDTGIRSRLARPHCRRVVSSASSANCPRPS